MDDHRTTRAPVVWRNGPRSTTVEGYCPECGEELFAGYCACGGPAERTARMLWSVVAVSEAAGALEAAALQVLERGDRSASALEQLENALERWLDERRSRAGERSGLDGAAYLRVDSAGDSSVDVGL